MRNTRAPLSFSQASTRCAALPALPKLVMQVFLFLQIDLVAVAGVSSSSVQGGSVVPRCQRQLDTCCMADPSVQGQLALSNRKRSRPPGLPC